MLAEAEEFPFPIIWCKPKKPSFENRPKAPKWEVAERILLPALDFNLMLLSVTKYGASQVYLNFSSVRSGYLCRGNE